jgi:hypothetical protein
LKRASLVSPSHYSSQTIPKDATEFCKQSLTLKCSTSKPVFNSIFIAVQFLWFYLLKTGKILFYIIQEEIPVGGYDPIPDVREQTTVPDSGGW